MHINLIFISLTTEGKVNISLPNHCFYCNITTAIIAVHGNKSSRSTAYLLNFSKMYCDRASSGVA